MEPTTIRLTENGPLEVEGCDRLLDPDGNPFNTAENGPTYLCRCGGSQNKPFCDGTHQRSNFVADERVPQL